MKHLFALSCLGAVLAVAAPAADAQQAAYTAKDVHLRAGPGSDYPMVAVLRAGTAITVDGCEADYRWCDVEVGSYRGWVYAGNIIARHVGVNEPVLSYGAAMGIGIVLFDLGLYWDSHYRGSPWYAQRPQWVNRPPPAHRPVPLAASANHVAGPTTTRPPAKTASTACAWRWPRCRAAPATRSAAAKPSARAPATGAERRSAPRVRPVSRPTTAVAGAVNAPDASLL